MMRRLINCFSLIGKYETALNLTSITYFCNCFFVSSIIKIQIISYNAFSKDFLKSFRNYHLFLKRIENIFYIHIFVSIIFMMHSNDSQTFMPHVLFQETRVLDTHIIILN